MPEKSGMFDSTADDPRQYAAREFAEYFARFIGNGIFGGGTKLKVSASGTDSNVSIAVGYGWINGYMYSVFDTPLVLPIVPATTQDRIDRIVLRLNVSTPVRAIKAMVLQGTPAASPSVPAITRSGDIYDLSLAQVRVIANTSVILPEQITDERLNTTVCGVVTGVVQQADTTAIFNQFQSWLNTKTVEYQQQWSDFLETVQDEGFATTQYVDQKAGQAETNAKNASAPLSHVHAAADITTGTLAAARLPTASISAVGIVQLNNTTTSTSTTQAATAAAVKAAMDQANSAFQSASDGKALVATAITGKGVATAATDTFATMAANINAIQTVSTAIATVTFNSDSAIAGGSLTATIPSLGFTPTFAAMSLYFDTIDGSNSSGHGSSNEVTISTDKTCKFFDSIDVDYVTFTLSISGTTLILTGSKSFNIPGVSKSVRFVK